MRPAAPTRATGGHGDCPCGLRLWRTVLNDRQWPDGADLVACLGCGWVRMVHVWWDFESNPHESRLAGYADEELAPEVREWAGAWPRHAEAYGNPCFVPAPLRVSSPDELLAVERIASAARSHGSPLTRVEAAGWPAAPPPPDLPEELAFLSFAWWVMTTPDEDVAAAVRGGTAPPGAHGGAKALAFEKACRHDWANDLSVWLTGPDRDLALREIAERRRRLTSFESWPILVAGPPPGARRLVEKLVAASAADPVLLAAALAAFEPG